MKQRQLFQSQYLKAALLAFLALAPAPGSTASAAPAISLAGPDTASITDKQQNFYTPFSNVTINDSDGIQITVSIRFSPTGLGSFRAPLPSGVTGSAGSYTIGKATAADATTAIRAIIFDPQENQIDVGSSGLINFTFWATDTNGVSSTTNSDRNVSITPVNDPPTIIGVSDTTTTDKISVSPFSGVTLGDVDNQGLQPLSLQISMDDTNKGAFTNYAPLGFALVGTNYTLSGAADTLTAAIRQLVFDPTENRLPVGLVETTAFRIQIDDGIASPVTDNSTSVAATSINDPPTVGGVSATRQQVATGNSVTPFSAATIIDVDRNDDTNRFGQSLTLSVSLTGANPAGQLEAPGGFAGASYAVNDVNGPEATALLRALVYRAPSLPVSGTNTYGFTIAVTDGHGGSASDASAAVDVFSLTTAPTLFGTQTGQHVNDNTTVAPFSTVTVRSSNGTPISASIQLDDDAKGQLVNLSGFTKQTTTSPATYSAVGSVDQITAALHTLVFQPTANRLNGAVSETVVFTITISSSGQTAAPDSSTTVIVAPVNDRPVITGITASATIQDNVTIRPFPNVSITDADESGNQSNTVRVALDYPTNGAFASGSLSSFRAANGGYLMSGTPAQITTAIRQLVFIPTPQLVPVGLSTNITFSITANDGYGGVASNQNTVLLVAAISGAPFVGVPSQQPLSLALVTPLHPLGLVTISAAQNLRVTVAVAESAGIFTSNSLASSLFTSNNPGSYLFIGSAVTAMASIQNLEFLPNTNLVVGTVIRFTIIAVDPTPNSYTATLDIKLRQTQRSHIVTKTGDYSLGAPDSEKFGTLRKAVEDASSNDHITFDLRSPDPSLPDYPRTIRLGQTIVLDKTLTFDGPGADLLTLAGDDTNGVPAVQLLIVQPGISVTLNRLTLTKGAHAFSGGAIEVNVGASLKLSYCAITESTAGFWGGGIDVNGGALSMDHCLIHSNRTSRGLGQGGGGISLYTDKDCSIANSTFSANQQLASGGLGGAALYVENSDVGHEMDVFVLGCTFANNSDAAGFATSIRPNAFDANVFVQNSIFADGSGHNLYLDGGGMILSLGGNSSDDSTRTTFSIGGASYDIVILDGSHDRTNQIPALLPLGPNGGPTPTFGLAELSPAINSAISNENTATFFSTQGTDQRGFWRADGQPDVGAFERSATNRIIIEEILFAPAAPNTNDQFIEFYVPRDSARLNLLNYQVFVGGLLKHTFDSQPLDPGQALVLFSQGAANTGSIAAGVPFRISSNKLLMDTIADTITLKNPAGQTVFEVNYIGLFTSSDPSNTPYLANPNQSIILSPQFQGDFLPYQLVAQKEGGSNGRTNFLSGPGSDVSGNSLGGGNFPPQAFADSIATDAHTRLVSLPVLANDLDLDIADSLRVVGVGVTNAFPSGAPGLIIPPGEATLSSASLLGAAVTVISNGASISYDPTASPFLQSLPQGSNVLDQFQYTVLDSSNGVDHIRGTNSAERSYNILKATATVTISVAGVNSPPTPQDDSLNTNGRLTTSEDRVLDFTTADTILANDTDPNTDDNSATLTIISVEPANVFQNSLQAMSVLGAVVTLDVRFDRNQTHITYDPLGSPLLESLGQGMIAVDTFYYSVRDRHGAIGSAAVHITVTGVNDPPQATADALATDEDTPLVVPFATLFANDIDPDTGIINPIPPHLTVSAVTPISALGALVRIVGGTVVYDPTYSTNLNALARKEVVIDTFTYTAQDDFGAPSNAVVSVTVTGVNDRPVAAPHAFTIDEDSLLAVPASGVFSNSFDFDVNSHQPDDSIRILPFANRLTAAGAPVTLNSDGSFSYDPRMALDWLPANSNWVDSFTYTLLDGSLTIANNDSFSVQGNSVTNLLPVLANDVALAGTGGQLTITSVTAPTQGGVVTINGAQNALVYSPLVNFYGTETFTYSISDGQGGTDTATVTILVTVTALNAGLAANPDSFTVARGTTVNLNVLANDNIQPASGSTLSILGVTFPTGGGTAILNGAGPNNSISYTPNLANPSPFTETFTYQISGGGSIQATGMVTVTAVSSILTANDDNFTVLAGAGDTVLDVLNNDRIFPGPNTNLIIVSVQQTNGLTGVVAINSSASRLLYQPRIDVLNQQEPFFTYTITDGAGGFATGTVSVVVARGGMFANKDLFTVMKNSQSNSLPVLINDAILPNMGQTLTVTDTGLGPDSPNQGGSVGILNGQTILYTPASNYFGPEIFTYEISDGSVARARGQVRVIVLDTSVLRTSPDAFNVARDSSDNAIDVLRNDFRLPRTPGTLRITSVGTPGRGGVIRLSSPDPGNLLFYTPAAGFIGTETFPYSCADSYGNTGSNLITVAVGGLMTRADAFSVLSDSSSNLFDVLTNDFAYPDSASVRRISGLGQPDRGGIITTNASATWLSYSPGNHFVGTERFSYQVSDDSGQPYTENVTVTVVRAGSDRDTNTVTITVIGINDAPTITGAQGGFHITDKQTIQPFTNVTIADVDLRGLQPLTVKVILDSPAKGALQNLAGFTSGPPGTYTLHGLGSNITAALRGLIFVPVENRITVPTTETTRFTLSADDGYVTSPVLDANTMVDVTAVNDSPLITGTLAGQHVYDRLSIRPFAGVLITEVDDLTLQPLKVTVSEDQPAHGYLTSLGGFIPGSNGVYSLTNVTAAQATLALRTLLFVPTTGARLGANGSETNRFTLAVNDGFAPTVTDANTTVIAMGSFIKELLGSNGLTTASFGYTVSANRDLVLVGAPRDTGAASQSGTAYLYSRNFGSNDSWTQFKKLQASDGKQNDQFGAAVGLDGDTLVIGAPFMTNKPGAVYIFERNTNGPNAWGQSRKLFAFDGSNNDRFGDAVAIFGDTILVGSYQNRPGSARSGAAYIYGRNQGGPSQWGLVKKIVPGDGADGDNFGFSVGINGDSVVVGSRFNTGLAATGTGAAYVFDRNLGGLDQWGLAKKITVADGMSGAAFGYSVAISGDLIIAGAPYEDPDSTRSGAAYVFGRDIGGPNQWSQLVKLAPFDGRDGDEFGFSVTIDGELMAVSSHLDSDGDSGESAGAVYVYARNYPGLPQWGLLEKLVPLHYDGSEDDGFVVSLSRNTLAVGEHLASGSQSGRAFIYRLKFNNPPFVAQPFPDQVAIVGTPFAASVANVFAEPDADDSIVLSAVIGGTNPPPAWLSFDPATGTFSGTPDAPSFYPILVTATDEEGAAVTDTFNLIVLAVFSPIPPAGKGLWRLEHFGATAVGTPGLEATLWGDDADPDGDGLNNLTEYLVGTDPLVGGDQMPKLSISIADDGSGDVIVKFKRRANDPQCLCVLLMSFDLISWQNDASLPHTEPATPVDGGMELVNVRVPASPAPPSPLFFRLKLQYQP